MGSLAVNLIKLNNLQLVGKLVSERALLGVHESKRIGSGVEFEQYKSYYPGDDLKHIDWKLYARTGKFLIKQSSAESNQNIHFMLDLSGSMNYSENEVSRLQFAQLIIASLAYLGYRQGDPMRLSALKNGKIQTLVSEGKNNFQKLLYQLEKVEAEGNWDTMSVEWNTIYSNQKEVVVWVSDFLQIEDEWETALKALASNKRQILLIQVLGNSEINFNIKGVIRFKDLESQQEMELDADAYRKEYLEKWESYQSKLHQKLELHNVKLMTVKLDDSLVEVIQKGIKQLQWSF